jgi:hypothetical protein
MKSLTLTAPITIRQSDEADIAALWRLAELDSAAPIDGPALIVENGNGPIAAITLDGEREIADPFEPTEGLLDLLQTWASQLRSS